MQWKITRVADAIADWTGNLLAWIGASVLVCVWLLGLLYFGIHNFGYDMLVSTGTSLVTFIMVFLIQHTSSRGNRAIQLKLDALIAAQEQTENKLIGAEERPAAEIKLLQEEAREQLREAAEEEVERD